MHNTSLEPDRINPLHFRPHRFTAAQLGRSRARNREDGGRTQRVHFEIVGEIEDIETIARGLSVRERARLTAQFGRGRWRKLKGKARVRLPTGVICQVELHWYEAHGIGRKKFKIKRFLE